MNKRGFTVAIFILALFLPFSFLTTVHAEEVNLPSTAVPLKDQKKLDWEKRREERGEKREDRRRNRKEKIEERKAKREERQAERREKRCEIINKRIQIRISRFKERKDRHAERYDKVKERLTRIAQKLEDKGYDTSKLTDDLKTLAQMIKEYFEEYIKFISLLSNIPKTRVCKESKNTFRDTLSTVKEQVKIVRSKRKAIKEFYKNVIRKDIQELRNQKQKLDSTD